MNQLINPGSARQIAANLRAIENAPHAPAAGDFVHDHIVAANASLFTEAYFSEPLTTYATGWRDPANLDAALEFFAPMVPVPRRFEYAEAVNAEEFLSDSGDDDLRAIGADFKSVEYTSEKRDAHTDNRGLQICVDLDQVADRVGWRESYTAKLTRRLLRNSLRRAITLLSAASVNTAKTWDTTSGKDPDQDMIAELILAANISGISPNRIGIGDTAFTKRLLAHRAQNTAGGFASAALSEEALAAFLGVDQVYRSRERYQSGAATKAEILGNLVFFFSAMGGADTEDPSNIKRFVSSVEGGGYRRVYEQQLSAKRYVIAVEHYELIKITSTLGIRKFTVS